MNNYSVVNVCTKVKLNIAKSLVLSTDKVLALTQKASSIVIHATLSVHTNFATALCFV